LGVNKNVSTYSSEPIQINFNIIDISCGYFHNIILTNNGNSFGFGDNSAGQLGISNGYQETYVQNFILNNIIQISSGSFHSLLLNNKNQLYSFGSNSDGQLGLNLQLNINITIPTQIILQYNDTIKQISCGNYHSLILNNTGSVYSFGLNNVNCF
jgi:E3 ubiquitin-protein ligase HERC4